VNICFAMLYYDAHAASADPARYLDRVPLHRELPLALAARGHTVDVVYLYPHHRCLVEGGVRHHFVAPGRAAQALGRMARALGREPALLEPAVRAAWRIRSLKPDIVHFHGLTLTWNLWLLRCVLGRHAPPLVLHYHGGYPPANPLARAVQGASMRRAARLLFTTREHARPFVAAGMIADDARVAELVETSSAFRPLPRDEARGATGMHGDPVCLWAGRLHPIKDPLTALRAFERIAEVRPAARLYLHYLTAELEGELRAFVAARPRLAAQVEFRGRAPFEQMQAIYSSADFLLQASRREFSGCAVLEAMACGAIPAVSNIPSFRAMTCGGRFGVLFPPGDAEALARAVLAIPPDEIAGRSAAVRAHFERALSFPAMAARLEEVYRGLTLNAER
jgi:glycosyltransferase involved in cell wall biosynthesis